MSDIATAEQAVTIRDGGGNLRRFELVRIADLHIDQSYQRDLSLDLVEKIQRNYDPKATSVITVVRRSNGDLYVVNGQHRAAGAKRSGDESILAEVFEDLGTAEESELRLKGNTRRTDKPQERFRAQVAAGHKESIAISAIAESYDTRVNRNPDATQGINCVSALESIYRADREGLLLGRVLEFVQDSFGNVEGENATVSTLKGSAFLLSRNGADMDRARMVEKLGKHGVRGIQRIAVNHKAAMGGAMWMNYYRTFIEIYNERLQPSSQLEWRTAGASRVFRGVDGQTDTGSGSQS